ncbi:LysR family transcriptional regulator [Shewanella surugensis]|uniref:LysR family transcriptional regulator n=1 Tax=Shewanella surugensis TaxID=212020 RepID=A0ABT0L777_9GAMM|nr:LysR family transcriptional regulator [Shewanella surugensis]MCL1123006.1 LysR family transcriptional regulator [Shewanella surugensis]
MLNKLDLNLLTVFIAVYRHCSITLAAEEMGLTQPGVSGLLKRLQQQVGVELFVRSGRGIVPTTQAKELIRTVEPALIQLNNAIENLKTFSIESSRTFVVYASEPAMLLLAPKIETDDSLGNIKIELQSTSTDDQQLADDLSRSQADLAIEYSSNYRPSLFSEEFLKEDICVIARKGHPRISDHISREQYYKEKHITLKLRRENTYLIDYFTEEAIEDRNIAAECTSLMSQMAMVSTTNSIAVMPVSTAKLHADNMRIQVINSPFNTLPVFYRMIAHNRERKSPSNIWLREKLKSYFIQDSEA